MSAVTLGPRLGQVEPRERAGAQTGRHYEYQYERTARAALDLLDDTSGRICVYCDWQDDYVIELTPVPTRYVFCQVKGRKLARGPWKFSELFGLRKKRSGRPSKSPARVKEGAVIPLMLRHHRVFKATCAGLCFVTNAGLHADASGFLEAIRDANALSDLAGGERIAFDSIAQAYVAADPRIATSAEVLFDWLHGLSVLSGQGQIDDANAALLEIAGTVVEFSEIELLQRQAKQIGREVIALVRNKVGYTSVAVPVGDDELRRSKGILVRDLLGVLSLSAEAYEQLRSGAGSESVKTLSRLQRFCEKHGLSDHIVPICDFKSRWDTWRTIERHFLDSADYLLLHQKAGELLIADLTVKGLIAEAKAISSEFSGLTGTPLTPEVVVGLIFSLAAESEALNVPA